MADDVEAVVYACSGIKLSFTCPRDWEFTWKNFRKTGEECSRHIMDESIKVPPKIFYQCKRLGFAAVKKNREIAEKQEATKKGQLDLFGNAAT